MLNENFRRVLVGYDIRRPARSNSKELFLTSYDESMRFEDIYENNESLLSGMNLFWQDPLTLSSLRIPAGARFVAFDLPEDYVNWLARGSVSVPSPVPAERLNSEWDFLGFDVVDAFTQTSGLHGLGSREPKIFNEIVAIGIATDNSSLIASASSAIAVAERLDLEFPEHSPFAPCGIWLRHQVAE